MHLAETREQAVADVAFGLGDWVDYFQRVAALPLAPDTANTDLVDAINASGFAVIGTPDDAIAQISRLAEQSGGFGTFLIMAHEWADRSRPCARTSSSPGTSCPPSRARPRRSSPVANGRRTIVRPSSARPARR